MGLEAGGTGIVGLNSSNPATGDNVSQGDDHIRLVKAELLREFPNFVASTPVTATQTELNILDGATLTVTELNTLDASAQAVTGFTYSNLYYIDDTGDSQTGNSFDVATNIGAAWESVGPTGSGATNIWTALDVLPSTAKWVEIGIYLGIGRALVTGVSSNLYARAGGSAVAANNYTRAATAQSSDTNNTGPNVYTYTTKKIPVDSSIIFDLYHDFTASPNTHLAEIYLVGFGV